MHKMEKIFLFASVKSVSMQCKPQLLTELIKCFAENKLQQHKSFYDHNHKGKSSVVNGEELTKIKNLQRG